MSEYKNGWLPWPPPKGAEIAWVWLEQEGAMMVVDDDGLTVADWGNGQKPNWQVRDLGCGCCSSEHNPIAWLPGRLEAPPLQVAMKNV